MIALGFTGQLYSNKSFILYVIKWVHIWGRVGVRLTGASSSLCCSWNMSLGKPYLCLPRVSVECFCFVFAKHIIVGRLFRNIHPSLQYSSRSLIHTSLYDFFLTCTSCTIVTVCTIFVFKLFTIIIKLFGAWADFQISCTMEGRR